MHCSCCHKNKPLPNRQLCGTCKTRRYRDKYRIKYAFYALKHNAKRRGHAFDLTLQEFEKFAIATDYMVKKGKTVQSYSIDRIDNNNGYTIDNIRVLTLSENSKKHTKKVVYDWYNRDYFTVTLPDTNNTFEEVPF